jgi:hypothetical protein
MTTGIHPNIRRRLRESECQSLHSNTILQLQT